MGQSPGNPEVVDGIVGKALLLTVKMMALNSLIPPVSIHSHSLTSTPIGRSLLILTAQMSILPNKSRQSLKKVDGTRGLVINVF